MSKEQTTNAKTNKTDYNLKVLQLIVGVILLVFLLIFDAYVKEVPIYIIAIPGFLIGLDPREFFNGKGKNDKDK